MVNSIDAKTLKNMFLAGTKNLASKKDWINELNVFPVPDGDTGTNMMLTLMSAVKELKALNEDASLEEVGKRIASGTLKGARGNSGVIMSQLCRGFVKEIDGASEIDIKIFVDAFDRAQVTAYKAVMKPKEGTILTVAKGVAQKAAELSAQEDLSLNEFFVSINENAEEVLAHTPEMLPVLKEAGVVDSGGQGLLEFLKGAYDAYSGKEVDVDFSDLESAVPAKVSAPVSAGAAKTKKIDTSRIETADIKFAYCTEFIIQLEKRFHRREEQGLKKYLSNIGDSLVCVSMDDIVKVHVHTNDPGLAIQKALSYGSLSNIKIDNMREEHNERIFADQELSEEESSAISTEPPRTPSADESIMIEKEPEVRQEEVQESEKAPSAQPEEIPESEISPEPELPPVKSGPKKEYGFVAVCSGDGLKNVFKNMSVDEVIEGGQTMNPSTEDILEVINKVNADNIYVLPNNGNIILAAEQTKHLCEEKNIIVIPTKTIAQGITAVINYVPAMNIEENAQHMAEAIKEVKTAEITYAVRDTTLNEKEIKKGDYMAIGDDGLLSVGTDVIGVTMEAIREMFDEDAEIVTVYYGEDSSEDDAARIAELVEEEFEDAEVDVVYGGQPVYNFIVSVE